MKFRKKPVEIEARQYTIEIAANDNLWNDLAFWCKGLVRGTKLPAEMREIEIPTLEGDHRAVVGDWIIKGVKGEFYPCKPDIFALTYDEVK